MIIAVAASIAVRHQSGVEASFEALPRVGNDLMPPPGQRDAHRVEQGTFDEHGAGGFIATGRLAADDTGDRLHARLVADRAIFGVDDVIFAVQRADRFAPATPQRQHVTLDFRDIEHMQGPAEIDGEEVRDVDQRVDRPQPDGRQPILQPFRRGRVSHTLNRPADDPRAGLGEIDLPARAAIDRGRYLSRLKRLQCAKTGGGEIAGDASDTETIAAVGRDTDLDDRIVEPSIRRIGHADRCVVRQFDDARVILTQSHFASGQKHAGTLHAADFADLERDIRARNETAGRGEHRFHSGSRVWRTAYDLFNPTPVSTLHARKRSALVRQRLDHMRDAEIPDGGASAFSTPSSSSPMRVSASVMSPVEASVSR